MNNKIWLECQGGQYILYTEDRRLITDIQKRKRLAGKVRDMAEYYRAERPFAWQMRFEKSCLSQIRKMAGLTPSK